MHIPMGSAATADQNQPTITRFTLIQQLRHREPSFAISTVAARTFEGDGTKISETKPP